MDADDVRPPTVLILASGRGERFLASGGKVHKLKALLHGKPVLEHTLDAVRASGLPWHLEDIGHPGMGDSIAAAVGATVDANGWLILPGDLPLVRPTSLQAVADQLNRAHIVVPVYGRGDAKARGHPVGFPRLCKCDLLALSGDRGASILLKRYPVTELPVDDPGVMADVDTIEDLARLSR